MRISRGGRGVGISTGRGDGTGGMTMMIGAGCGFITCPSCHGLAAASDMDLFHFRCSWSATRFLNGHELAGLRVASDLSDVFVFIAQNSTSLYVLLGQFGYNPGDGWLKPNPDNAKESPWWHTCGAGDLLARRCPSPLSPLIRERKSLTSILKAEYVG